MKLSKIVYLSLGFVGLALGALGAVVPLIPSVPFLLLSAFGFAKSSERLHSWFISTKLYKSNLESFVDKKGMPWSAKLRIMSVVTITMAIGFFLMGDVPVGRIVLVIVWVCHVLCFVFVIKSPK